MYKKLFGREAPVFVTEYTDDELVRIALIKRKLGNKKVVCNMTTIPPRFSKIQNRVDALKKHLIFDEIVVHVPKQYSRFPGEHNLVLDGATVNIVDQDYGPGTRIIEAKGDIVVYCDDDTEYSHTMSTRLVERHVNTNKCWGGSGFNFAKYFIGDFSKTDYMQVQVIEGYGMVVLNREWIDRMREDFIKLCNLTYADDMVTSNLLAKIGVDRMVCIIENGFRQLPYGFDKDALHYNNGENTHVLNYKRVLQSFREIGENHFEPVISYAIGVCNEHIDLDNLLYTLVENIIHCDEIVVLVDSGKVTQEVRNVLDKYGKFLKVHEREFDGHFANHKNFLNENCKGAYIFNIDADEVPTYQLVKEIYGIIAGAPDLVYLPRVNILAGANEDFIKKCNFSVNEVGYINWPDMQGRLYRNIPGIKWVNKLHEKIDGAKNVVGIQPNPLTSLWHIKSVQRMKAQDEYYQKLVL